MPIEFEQNNDFKNGFGQKQTGAGLPGLLIKSGLAKDAKEANIILLIISLIFLVLMFFILYHFVFAGSSSQNAVNPNNAKVIKGFIDQGLRGQAFIDKVNQARASGLIK